MQKREKEENNNMSQNVYDSDLKYQELLILAYFKAHYKKYEFNDIVQMMGMTYAEMKSSIEKLLELKYLVYIEKNLVLSKAGENVLEERNLAQFFDNKQKEQCKKEQLSINEPYIPIKFEM